MSVKELKDKYPDLSDVIRRLKRENRTDKAIADYFNEQGFHCSTSTIVRLRKEYVIVESLKHSGNAFRGHKHSEETKQKLSEIKIETRASRGVRNYFYGKRDELSPTWKGGITSDHDMFFGSSIWKNARKFILKKDDHACQLCGTTEKRLSIHHIVPLSMDLEKKLDLTNLVTLCNDCHKKTFSREGLFMPVLMRVVQASWRTEPNAQKEFMKAIDPR